VSANNRIVSIVDDDPATTIFFNEALRSIPGITVFTFTDPILALEHFQALIIFYNMIYSGIIRNILPCAIDTTYR
jgi:hypothetical protein